MKTGEYRFRFDRAAGGTGDMAAGTETRLFLGSGLPTLEQIEEAFGEGGLNISGVLPVCDANTAFLAERISGGIPICVLPGGESEKNWTSVEKILGAAHAAGLGRDSLFIGVGGGVVSDLTAFAASVYMRGTRLCLVPTTLLGMVDAALGGKTGFDLFGIKNLAGTFYPAQLVYLSMESLATLPGGEWKSGMAELIKTAVLDDDNAMFEKVTELRDGFTAKLEKSGRGAGILASSGDNAPCGEALASLIARSMEIKGRIVEEDPRETGTRRALLNLGHSFGHALEAAAGLGRITHGEAVAWGMVRAAALGRLLGVTPETRAKEITALIRSYGYEVKAPHPLAPHADELLRAMASDKKKKAGKGVFVLPSERSARLVSVSYDDPRLKLILNGEDDT
jgi:3-dehydroquinate synthase